MTAFFRMVGAMFGTFDGASKVSGFFINATIMYTGYLIQRPNMHPWFGWLYWLNPLAYAFQSVTANELHGKVIPCVGNNIVPNGPGYGDLDHAACTGVGGARTGATSVTGDEYLQSLAYSHSNVWRNFGIIWALWAFFAAATIFFTSFWTSPAENGPSLLIPRDRMKQHLRHEAIDEESQVVMKGKIDDVDQNRAVEQVDEQLVHNTSVFTWKNLTYTVKTPSGDRVLLDNVQGWVKPGMLGALMGSSGAGKTTLLDVLAQRKTEGTINGSILVDGRPLPVSFQRSVGYCEQLDVHEPLATVREALEFSALLRQPHLIPRQEKLAYVDTIINLLELHDISDTLIGHVGAGLSVEQRKRVTIGVELVSKPVCLSSRPLHSYSQLTPITEYPYFSG